MKSIHYTTLALSLAIVMTGCASNKGDFGVDNVQTPKPIDNGNTATTPTYTDDTSGSRRVENADTAEPALGYAVAIPRRVFSMRNPQPEDLSVSISDDKIKPINYELNQLPTIFSKELENNDKYIEDNGISYSHDKRSKATTRDLEFVRSGYVIAEKGMKFVNDNGTRKQDPAGQYGYVFYQGVNPAKSLPTTTATYKGTWDFVSDAKSTRQGLPEGFTNDLMDYGAKGNTAGATSLDADINRGRGNDKPVGLESVFDVNFADKKLTGKLIQNHNTTNNNADQIISDRYSIEADIKGNRFVGKAVAKDPNHAIFGKNSDKVEGGFFGDKAQELAGKFVADEGSLFAVFAGKRDTANDTTETKFDASKISTSDLTKSSMDTFGNAAYLVIDGKRLPLLPEGVSKFADMEFYHSFKKEHNGKEYQVSVCCNNLDYVKFGNYSQGGEGYLYLVGERTDTSKIPTTGQVHYRGTWDARIVSKDNKVWASGSPSNKPSGTRSLFDFDFGKKSFTGKLINDNGTDDRPVFELTGNIVGNGFTGIAKTRAGGFNIDGGSTAGGTLVNIEAVVDGGFYGADASEIGGTIVGGTDDKVGGVFGGKRQIKK